MKLDTATIAGLAREVGFMDRGLHLATALALASSGGLTSYRFRSGAPGTGHYVGLWAVDIDRYPEWSDADLHDPHTAAQAARTLTADRGGFGWSDVYHAGTWQHYVAHAATEATRYGHRPTDDGGPSPDVFVPHLHHHLDRVRAVTARLNNLPRPGVNRWPTHTR